MEDQEDIVPCMAEYNLFGEELQTSCIYPPEDEFHVFSEPEMVRLEGCEPEPDCGCYHHAYKPNLDSKPSRRVLLKGGMTWN